MAAGHTVTGASRAAGVDLAQLAAATELLRQRPDVIVNCAAWVGGIHFVTSQGADVADANLRIPLNVYRAAGLEAPEAVLVNPISNCVFPGAASHFREGALWDGPLHPTVLSFGIGRRVMMALGELYRAQYGLRSLQLLVPNMYGPGDSTDSDKAHALGGLVSRVVRLRREGGGPLQVWGSGAPVREWLYGPDFARLLLEVLERRDEPALQAPFNVARNAGCSVKELVDRITAAAGYAGPVEWDASRPDGAPYKVMDDDRFRALFPDFVFTDIDQGIRATVADYEARWPW